MKVPFVDLKKDYLPLLDELDRELKEIFETASFVLGEKLENFENEFAKYIKSKHAVGVASGTDALILSLRSLNIGRGDEVITTPYTFIATAESIYHVGATPIFVDINPDTYNIDTEKIEEKITSKTKAILPVHIYGQPADMNPILELAEKHDIFVIEDAAQAHGAMYKNTFAGSIGDIGCFSFYPGKNLGAFGDGGAITTDNGEIAETIKKLRNHGGIKKYQHDLIGYNSRLDVMQAAILNVKLKHLEKWNDMRIKNAKIYNELLSHNPDVITPTVIKDCRHIYHLYVLRLKNAKRSRFMNYLKSRNIDTGIHYPAPLHLTDAFTYLGYRKGNFPNSEDATEKIVSLPMYPGLDRTQIDFVVEEIKNFFREEI